jgi:tripartite-type tricarboxylate transporter receptor subunit TctC
MRRRPQADELRPEPDRPAVLVAGGMVEVDEDRHQNTDSCRAAGAAEPRTCPTNKHDLCNFRAGGRGPPSSPLARRRMSEGSADSEPLPFRSTRPCGSVPQALRLDDPVTLARRQFLHAAAAAAALPAVPRIARAQAYPTRPITMIVPFPAGCANDVIGRIVAERMRAPLGQSSSRMSAERTAASASAAPRARPDGYTICLSINGAFVHNSAFYSLPYDVLNDFAPISLAATGPIILVARKSLPAKDLTELIAWLKTHPCQASAGMNTFGFRLIALRFQQRTGTQFTIVPYRAAGGVIEDLVAERIDLAIGTLTSHLPMVRAGSEKPYAVAGDARSALAPDIPTFAEMGLPALTYSNWYALFAPKGTPDGYCPQAQCRGHRRACRSRRAIPARRARLRGLPA